MKLKPGAGDRIRRARRRMFMNQRTLAFAARCSQATISLLEREELKTFSHELARDLFKTLQAVGVEWEDLFEDRESSGARRVATGARPKRRTEPAKRGAA